MIELDLLDDNNAKAELFRKDINYEFWGQTEYPKHDESFCFGPEKGEKQQ